MQEITSRENPLVRDYVRLRESRSFRKESGRFVLEGARLLDDALKSGAKLETVFFTAEAREKQEALWQRSAESGAKICLAGEAAAARLADTKAPQGVFASAFMLDKAFSLDKINLSGAYAALENIRDPGNLGTMLRTAEALGLSGVLLSRGCADIYAPKVVRASMGAVFRLPFFETDDLPGALAALRMRGMKTLAALAGGTDTQLPRLDLSGGVAAAIGNEACGLSPACVAACTPFTIPMRGRAESLNAAAAAAIIMWEMMRAR